MYQKILVPLDGSREAERVIGPMQDELAPEGVFVLLQVIPRPKINSQASTSSLVASRRRRTAPTPWTISSR